MAKYGGRKGGGGEGRGVQFVRTEQQNLGFSFAPLLEQKKTSSRLPISRQIGFVLD